MKLEELNPQGVWKSFHALTQIPRPSGKKKEIGKFLKEYGESLGLETIQDKIGNVLIRKPASPGMEDHPGVILQGHMDMVPQKNSDIDFDFEKDPIRAYVDGEWVTAEGTTLGADNGIGVATAMAILADKSVVHPPLEAFFTVDEDLPFVGVINTRKHIHKGGLAATVLTEDGQNFSFTNIQVNLVVRYHRAKGLGDVFHLYCVYVFHNISPCLDNKFASRGKIRERFVPSLGSGGECPRPN